MDFLQWSFWIVGLTLQYLVMATLLTGPYKEFRALTLYTACLVITSVADIAISTDIGNLHRLYRRYYWSAELVRQSVLYCVVISLALRVVPGGPRRNAMVRVLVVLAMVFWFGSLTIHHGPKLNLWMTKALRDVSFCAAIIDLMVWFTLIASGRRDVRLLMISGGIGLQMTGEAIGQSLRQLSRETVSAGNIVVVVTHLLCLFIWWRALQAKPVASDHSPPLVSLRPGFDQP